MKTPYRFSPTQIECFALCPRRWWFKYVERRPEPEGRYTEWGSAFHGAAEWYLKTGVVESVDPTITRALLRGTRYLPMPKHRGLETEKGFERPWYDGTFAFHGYKDFCAPSAVGLPMPSTEVFGYDSACDEDIPLVGDHKTTGNLRYAKDERELATNTQALIYAWDALEAYPQAPAVLLNWVYYLRNGGGARPTRVRIARQQVVDCLETWVVPKVRQMLQILTALPGDPPITSRDIQPLPSACNAFGTCCPHTEPCGLSEEERTMGLLEHLMSSQPVTPATAPAAPPAPPAAPPAPPAPPAPVPAAQQTPPWQGAAVNPPGSIEVPPGVDQAQFIAWLKTQPEPVQQAYGMDPANPPATPATPAPAPAAPPASPAAPKRGRPRKTPEPPAADTAALSAQSQAFANAQATAAGAPAPFPSAPPAPIVPVAPPPPPVAPTQDQAAVLVQNFFTAFVALVNAVIDDRVAAAAK